MSELPENIATGLAVKETDKTLTALFILLDESIKAETSIAIGPEFSAPEKRAWQCGRADALTSFKELVIQVRKEAIEQRGLKDTMNNE